MRLYQKILGLLASVVLLTGMFVYLHIKANSNFVKATNFLLVSWAKRQLHSKPFIDQELVDLASQRIRVYEKQLTKNHLLEGMVVNRSANGEYHDRCDSLLFSALRFIALYKLGFIDEAHKAWGAIENSQFQGHWYRHPKCKKSTSRDMIVGLMAAMTQLPPRYEQHFFQLLNYIKEHDGYISDGPFYVSQISPGIAEILRQFARLHHIKYSELPDSIRSGFSTSEFTVSANQRGYRLHLTALIIWTELELERLRMTLNQDTRVHTVTYKLSEYFDQASPSLLYQHRLSYITQKLVEVEPENLFFQYLRLRTANALNQATRALLLKRLLTMRQFPTDQLPRDCVRKVDYLWQRQGATYRNRSQNCQLTYSGVDFLWMAALLLEADETIVAAN